MVYLVDDDTDDLAIVQDALKEYSYKGPVSTMTNGELLLHALQTENNVPGVIILDLNMPFVDGFTALRAVKTHPVYKFIPVIILTASSNKADEIRCFELGCDFFFVKPVKTSDYASLTAVVKRTLGAASQN